MWELKGAISKLYNNNMIIKLSYILSAVENKYISF